MSVWVKRKGATQANLFWGNSTNDIDEASPTSGTFRILRLAIFSVGFFYEHFDNSISGGAVLNKVERFWTDIPLDTWTHIAINYDGSVRTSTTPAMFQVFINARKLETVDYTSNINLFTNPQPTTLENTATGRWGATRTWNDTITTTTFAAQEIAEFIFIDRLLNTEEVRRLYNRATNDKSLYEEYYGNDILNSRILHYSFHQDDYVNDTPIIGQCTVTDLSGNGRDGIIIGQTSPQPRPDIVDFY